MAAEQGEQLRGVVYIAESTIDSLAKIPGAHLFEGHWEHIAARDFEDGPGWDSLDEAILWGRERAPEVILRIGRVEPQVHFSAGLVNLAARTDYPLPDWPPSIEDLPVIEAQADCEAEDDAPEVIAGVEELMRHRLHLLTRGGPQIIVRPADPSVEGRQD
jgi:hypothetical protein